MIIQARDLRDAYITEAIQESDSRLLLHLRDGRAVAIVASPVGDSRFPASVLTYVLTNPGGANV